MRYHTEVILATAALVASCDPSIHDNGQLVRGEVTLYSAPPLGVIASEEVRGAVSEAIIWWGEQIGEEVFFMPTPVPDVVVDEGYLEPGKLGLADIDYSRIDGLVVGCEVTLSLDLTTDLLEVTKHELGHCLALDDDAHSLDLNSVMSSPALPSGEVTEKDRDLVRAMLLEEQ